MIEVFVCRGEVYRPMVPSKIIVFKVCFIVLLGFKVAINKLLCVDYKKVDIMSRTLMKLREGY